MLPPYWAANLSQRIANDYKAVAPFIVWSTRRSKGSTGYCQLDGQAIGVRAGSDQKDARYTILHEMAHLILIQRGNEYTGQHNDVYYDFLWPMLRRYHAPMRRALRCESVHHPRAVERTYRRGGGRLKY